MKETIFSDKKKSDKFVAQDLIRTFMPLGGQIETHVMHFKRSLSFSAARTNPYFH